MNLEIFRSVYYVSYFYIVEDDVMPVSSLGIPKLADASFRGQSHWMTGG